jgi:hypothetical protein
VHEDDRVKRSGTLPAPPGAVRLAVPAGYRARWLSDSQDRASVAGWTSMSPELTVHSTPSYIDFARLQNGRADLLWLARDGHPTLGVPLHPAGARRIATGYSGLMFGAGSRDGPLRRGVQALVALLGANRRFGFQVLQSAQAPAYADTGRVTSLACLLDRQGFHGPPLYTRVLSVEPLGAAAGAAADAGEPEAADAGEPDVSSELLLEHGLRPCEAELRNQIRQAVRNGLRVTCSLPRTDAEIAAAYREFVPLHRESWQRTGMTPHGVEYWGALVRAIVDGGGRDLVVFARDADGAALAAVTCHLGDGAALYWAGASSESGRRLRANPLCLHAAIQACRQLGVWRFELGRFDARDASAKEQAIDRYKAQFGGELVRVHGFQTEPRGARALSALRARARGAAGRRRLRPRQ